MPAAAFLSDVYRRSPLRAGSPPCPTVTPSRGHHRAEASAARDDLPIEGADRCALAAGKPNVERVRTSQLSSDGDRSRCPRGPGADGDHLVWRRRETVNEANDRRPVAAETRERSAHLDGEERWNEDGVLAGQKADQACARSGVGGLRGTSSGDRHAGIEDDPHYSIPSSRSRPSAAAVDIFDFGASATISSMKASACAFVITRPFDRPSATRTGTIAAAGFP